jgi:hypothetical protein
LRKSISLLLMISMITPLYYLLVTLRFTRIDRFLWAAPVIDLHFSRIFLIQAQNMG